jgi:hypothetical protein
MLPIEIVWNAVSTPRATKSTSPDLSPLQTLVKIEVAAKRDGLAHKAVLCNALCRAINDGGKASKRSMPSAHRTMQGTGYSNSP